MDRRAARRRTARSRGEAHDVAEAGVVQRLPAVARVGSPSRRAVRGRASPSRGRPGPRGRRGSRRRSRAGAGGGVSTRLSPRTGRGEQLLDRAEVVRRAGHHDEVLGAGVEVLAPGRRPRRAGSRRSARSRSGGRSSLAHHSSRTAFFAAKFAGGPNVFHDVGVLGDEPQRHLLAAAADQDRQVARGRRGQRAEPVDDQRERVGEVAQPRRARCRTRSRTPCSRARTSPSRCRGRSGRG